MAATCLAATRALNVADTGELPMTLIAGCIGEGPTLELLNFLKKLDLGNPVEFLKEPSKFKLPDRSDRAFAMLSSVAALALAPEGGNELQGKMKKEEFAVWKWQRTWEVLGVVCDQGGTDIAAVVAHILTKAENIPDGWNISQIPPTVKKFAQLLKVVEGVS